MRPAIAERKAVLCLELHNLVRRVPPQVNAAGVQTTRAWVRRQKAAFRVCASERSSCNQLADAIASMRAPFEAFPT